MIKKNIYIIVWYGNRVVRGMVTRAQIYAHRNGAVLREMGIQTENVEMGHRYDGRKNHQRNSSHFEAATLLAMPKSREPFSSDFKMIDF